MDHSHPKHVGIWIRVSTEDHAKGESPEHHEKRARYYAESKGWKTSLVDQSTIGIGGLKDVIFTVKGKNVYAAFRR